MPAAVFSDEERRRRLAHRHLLSPSARADDPAAVADALVCIHSSDPVSAYLSAAVRMAVPSLEAVGRALYEDYRLIRFHAMRRTLWVSTPETARLAHAAAAVDILVKEQGKMASLLEERGGIGDGRAWMEAAAPRVLEVLRVRGEADTRTLGRELPDLRVMLDLAPGKPYNAQQSALARLLFLMGFEGRIVRGRPDGGSWISSQYQWAAMTDRFPNGLGGEDPEGAAAELARRWLDRFGPAPETDLRWWTGWTAAKTRRALKRAGAAEVPLPGGRTGWMNEGDDAPTGETPPWTALLPGLDPTAMGWKDKDWFLNPERAQLLFDRNGNAGPTAWVNGRIVGGWAQRPDGEIAIRLLAETTPEQRDDMDQTAHRLQNLIGDARFKVRFPAPLQKQLLA